MRIGPLFIGWVALPEPDRIELGLDPWPGGWEVFCIEWRDSGFFTVARRSAKGTHNGN